MIQRGARKCLKVFWEISVKLTVECDREQDGRWLAEVRQLPGVSAYGESEIEAVANAQIIALRVLAADLETRRVAPADISLSIHRPFSAGIDESPVDVQRDDSADYQEWLDAEVQEAIDDDAPTVPHEDAIRQIRAAVFSK